MIMPARSVVLPVCLPVCLSVYLSVCLSVSLSLSLSLSLFSWHLDSNVSLVQQVEQSFACVLVCTNMPTICMCDYLSVSQVDRIIFCVFLAKDLEIYQKLLPAYFPIGSANPGTKQSDHGKFEYCGDVWFALANFV